MPTLIPVTQLSDIPAEYRNTPIGKLLEFQNLGRETEAYDKAEILLGMCMDNRKSLNLPENFAFVIRNGGADMKYCEFKISYAVAVGELSYMALIGHTDCAMVNLHERKDTFVKGLIEYGGWSPDAAKAHFDEMSPQYEIHHETEFALKETERLRKLYPALAIVPMLYKIEDRMLYLIKE